MHWQITTAVRDANDRDQPFRTNACQRDGAGTATLKKVTCSECKPLTVTPRTPLQVANIYLAQLRKITENEDMHASIVCNACDHEREYDVFRWGEEHNQIAVILDILSHCAYDHGLGAEAMVTATWAPVSVYELNLAMGKDSGTEHEVAWRERLDAKV